MKNSLLSKINVLKRFNFSKNIYRKIKIFGHQYYEVMKLKSVFLTLMAWFILEDQKVIDLIKGL
ncbi:hypothetical protein A0H76_2925 [Hepatospora eriocheir]|uniref:Uncharacterized protein n=1 Tax=Hepatospora eriocheir TaxID=1081669 RepID=A0A1X0Q5H5_9MICR|nr:hypothetical protein A0H76_2925 [Hepatospora eriocheir]